MKINRKKQRGATLISWLIVAGLGVMAASAVVKVAPYYVEFNSVKKMLISIGSDPAMKTANKRQVNAKIEKFLDINSLYGLEKAYYGSKGKDGKSTNPFTITRTKKSRYKKLTVKYSVPEPWVGNLSFLINFEHSVLLGKPKK